MNSRSEIGSGCKTELGAGECLGIGIAIGVAELWDDGDGAGSGTEAGVEVGVEVGAGIDAIVGVDTDGGAGVAPGGTMVCCIGEMVVVGFVGIGLVADIEWGETERLDNDGSNDKFAVVRR